MKKVNKIRFQPIILLGFVLVTCFAISCKKEQINQVPILTTFAVTSIFYNTAICGGIITNDGGKTVNSQGVCWSTISPPTLNDNFTTADTANKSFSNTLVGLSLNTTYYVRAYATNMLGTGYGNTVSFKTPQHSKETITDIDDNVYNTVVIGTQTFTVENSKVTHYNNGDPIPNVTVNSAWSTLKTGALAYYNNDQSNGAVYGALYDFYVVSDPRGIAPPGYHVPTQAEWLVLSTAIGGNGCALRQTGTTLWLAPNWRATNTTGFTALPVGTRLTNGNYGGLSTTTTWWSSTTTVDGPVGVSVEYSSAKFDCGQPYYLWDNLYGRSLRFIKN